AFGLQLAFVRIARHEVALRDGPLASDDESDDHQDQEADDPQLHGPRKQLQTFHILSPPVVSSRPSVYVRRGRFPKPKKTPESGGWGHSRGSSDWWQLPALEGYQPGR